MIENKSCNKIYYTQYTMLNGPRMAHKKKLWFYEYEMM